MAAPLGNRFWEARSSAGPKPKFKKPEELWKACVEYFEWVMANPLYEIKSFHHQGEVIDHDVPKMRAMTIMGLCNFLGITEASWRSWRADRKDLLAVITQAEQIIRQQKFEGASADMLNPNIIARDLGLSDKAEVKQDITVTEIELNFVRPKAEPGDA